MSQFFNNSILIGNHDHSVNSVCVTIYEYEVTDEMKMENSFL